MDAPKWYFDNPTQVRLYKGFRVASAVPEPSTFLLVAAALSMCLAQRRRARDDKGVFVLAACPDHVSSVGAGLPSKTYHETFGRI